MSSSSSSSFSASSPQPTRSSSRRPRLSLRPRPHTSELVHPLGEEAQQQHAALTTKNILLFLIAFRILNALTVWTFFQPDEFFQSLEPAWELAFGQGAGAWISWEWQQHLRSSLHPLLFAAVYSIADILCRLLRLPPPDRAALLIAAPKCAQAVLAALGDFYTWKLACLTYGQGSNGAWATLALTVLSPWQWFCSTRTFSNCLETTLTVIALYFWPWNWAFVNSNCGDRTAPTQRDGHFNDDDETTRLRQCLCLAALASILRPTNMLIWISLSSFTLFGNSWHRWKVLIREALLCGSSILALTTLADRLFYGTWTFPPLKFLYFNIVESLAVFYGRNVWHYYASQGYPLLLTTALPFTLLGLYQTLVPGSPPATDHWRRVVLAGLSFSCLLLSSVLSLIRHKEVRFIYPLLPSLHVLTARPLVDFFLPAISRPSRVYTPRRLTLVFLLLVNVSIAFYTTLVHASGAISVLTYLREQYQAHSPAESSSPAADPASGITAGFLMPCHSTPWRSHLVYPSIHAWALSCDPPIGLTDIQKASYLDEADQFYQSPGKFLQQHMVGGLRHLPRKPSYLTSPQVSFARLQTLQHSDDLYLHEWPDYLIFFAQLESTLSSLLRGSSYAECRRFWNTAWHDDWRRRGDIVVWCLDPAEQQAWRTENHRRDQLARDYHFDRIVAGFKKEATAVPSWWSWWWKSSRTLGVSAPRVGFAPPSSSFSLRWPWQQKTSTGVFKKPASWFRKLRGLTSSESSPSLLEWPAWVSGWTDKKSKKNGNPFDDLWS